MIQQSRTVEEILERLKTAEKIAGKPLPKDWKKGYVSALFELGVISWEVFCHLQDLFDKRS